MILKNNKTVVYIIISFILLCAVSLYRQFGMHYTPEYGMVISLNDPVRAVAVFVVHLALLAGWGVSIRFRITQINMRAFLSAEHAVMLFWIIVRFLQAGIINSDIYLSRVSGYLVAVPAAFLPLFGLYASFGLGGAEDYRFNRKWYLLLIPAVMLAALTLTNESHGFVFSMPENEARPNLYYHPNIGIYLLLSWAFSLLLVRIVLIYRKSRNLADPERLRRIPFLIAVFMILYNIPYLFSSFVITYELIEYTLFLFLLEITVWESCISVGMVPVNTHYEDVFDRSTIAMQIVDEDGRVFLKSAGGQELSADMFDQLKRSKTVRITSEREPPDDRIPIVNELHIHPIRGGCSIWLSDVSQAVAVINELSYTADRMENEIELRRQEMKFRSEESSVREQNLIYSKLFDETGAQLLLINDMLELQDQEADKSALFRKICLIGTYIKRRCNLRLMDLSDSSINVYDLVYSFQDMNACLIEMGAEAESTWRINTKPAPEFAVFALDLFEFLLEYERFTLYSIHTFFESYDSTLNKSDSAHDPSDMAHDIADSAYNPADPDHSLIDTIHNPADSEHDQPSFFTVSVRHCRSSPPRIPHDELKRINGAGYAVRWHFAEGAYQVDVRDSKGG